MLFWQQPRHTKRCPQNSISQIIGFGQMIKLDQYISQASYKMQKGNIKVRRSLNRCTQKQNVQNLNINNLNRDKSNFSIPSLTMRPSKLLPHLEPSQEARRLIHNRSKPHQDPKHELRRASNTMVTKPIQSFKHITLVPLSYDQQTANLLHTYSHDYIRQVVNTVRPPVPFLAEHSVTPTLRARMVDWMIEVLASFKFVESTLFQAVGFLDRYFALSQKQQPKDLHCVGVISMFMASKMNQIFPLAMRTLFEKVVHKKISVEDLRDKETEFLKYFEFCLADTSSYDIAKLTLSILKSQFANTYKKHLDELQILTIYILKMTLFEYSILSEYSHIQIATCAIAVSARLISLAEAQQLTRSLESIWGQHNISDILVSKLQKLLKNFDKIHIGLGNLKRFNKINVPIMFDYDTL